VWEGKNKKTTPQLQKKRTPYAGQLATFAVRNTQRGDEVGKGLFCSITLIRKCGKGDAEQQLTMKKGKSGGGLKKGEKTDLPLVEGEKGGRGKVS